MRKKVLLILIYLSSTLLLKAQNEVKGIITNIEEEGIENVSIYVKGSNIKTTSNKKGAFSIKIPKGYNTLIFVAAGYIQHEKEINTKVIDIQLIRIKKEITDYSLSEILNMKVSISTKSETKLCEAPAIVSVITALQIKNMGARDLRDILQTVPGFQLGMRDMGYTTIGIRGITTPNSEKVMIMIDGVPVNENLEGSGTVVFADMVLDNVERIEIIRGPGSALYGANAFMAVINIISKKAKDTEGIIATVKGGTYNTFESNIIVSKVFGDFNVNSSTNYLTTDGAKQEIEIDALSNDSSGISLAGTDKGYTKLFRKKITSALNMDYKGLYSRTLYVGAEKGDYVGATSVITENSKVQHFQIQQTLGYKHSFSDKLSININGTYLLYSVDNILNLYPSGFAGIYTKGMYQEMGGKQQNININTQFNYNFSEKNKIQVGANYAYKSFYDEINKQNIPGTGVENLINVPSFFDRNRLSREIVSAYIQDYWELQKTLLITAGVRIDNYSDAGTAINPRVALLYNPTEKLNFKLLYGSAFRAPTFVETYMKGEPFLVGDENIKPEVIKTYEAYLAYHPNNTFSISANYFYNNITNHITLFPDTELAVGRYANSNSEINVHGIESELKVFIQTKSYIHVGYTCQKGVNSETEENIIGMANHTAFTGINHEFSKNWNINLYTNHIGLRKRASTDNRETLDGYTLVNVSILKNNIIKNLDIQLSGYNILNSDYRVPDITGLIYNDYPLEGISLMLKISYHLK